MEHATKPRIVMIIVGQSRTFPIRSHSLHVFLETQLRSYDIDIVISTSSTHLDIDTFRYKHLVRRILYLHETQFEHDALFSALQRHPVFQRMKAALIPGTIPYEYTKQQESVNDLPIAYTQWYSLARALEIVPALEIENACRYDIICKSRFDYCYPEPFNGFDIFFSTSKDQDYFDVITSGIPAQKQNLFKAFKTLMQHEPTTTRDAFLQCLRDKNIKVSSHFGRFSNVHRDVLLGGRYFHNLETLSHPDLNIKDTIYMFNDWFMYGSRDSMMTTFAQFHTVYSTIEPCSYAPFYFAPEYQVMLHARKTSTFPIMFLNEHAGGIDRPQSHHITLNDMYFHPGYFYMSQNQAIHLFRDVTNTYHITKMQHVSTRNQHVSKYFHDISHGDVFDVTIICNMRKIQVVMMSSQDVFSHISNDPVSLPYNMYKHSVSVTSNNVGEGCISIDMSIYPQGTTLMLQSFDVKRSHRPRQWVVTFYSQGENGSLDISDAERLFRESVIEHVDVYKSYSYSDLLETNPVMVKDFKTEFIHNPGSSTTGFFRWKPHIILETLEKMQDGDILMYRDCNVKKYPQYLKGVASIRELCRFVLHVNNTDIYVPIEGFGLQCKHHIKKELFEWSGVPDAFEKWGCKLSINASLIVARKSEASLRIVREWMDACLQDDLLSPVHNKNIQDPAFRWSPGDQPLLNIIILKHIEQGLLPRGFPRYCHKNRVFDFEHVVAVEDQPHKTHEESCRMSSQHNVLHGIISRYNLSKFIRR